MQHCLICNRITIPFWRSTSRDKKYSMHFMCHWRLITNQLMVFEADNFLKNIEIIYSDRPLLETEKQ